MANRKKRYVNGVGWVTPKAGFCWVNNRLVNRIRHLGENGPGTWGSRKYGSESIAESMIDR